MRSLMTETGRNEDNIYTVADQVVSKKLASAPWSHPATRLNSEQIHVNDAVGDIPINVTEALTRVLMNALISSR